MRRYNTQGFFLLCSLILLIHVVSPQVTQYNMSTLAGLGASSNGYNGDGILAVNAKLNYPSSVYEAANGEVYVSDSSNNRLRKILTNGTIVTVAGTGVGGYNGDGILAINAQVKSPKFIQMSDSGDVYFTEGYRIRKILAIDGTIATVAGNGVNGYNGDGLLAINTSLSTPTSFHLYPDGSIVFCDTGNHRIRKMFANGTIVTVAGTGVNGYNGDGILAVNAKLSSPNGLSVTQQDEIIIADCNNRMIRKILTNGTIIAIAGTGSPGYSGDGGLPTLAMLYNPVSVAVSSTNEIYISDSSNCIIRKILLNGTIVTIAGIPTQCGSLGLSTKAATSSKLDYPNGIYLTSTGKLYVVDGYDSTLRLLTPLTSAAGPDVQCFGISSSNSSVCGGHGTCISTDTCQCNSGWKGNSDCSAISCDGVNNCNGNGACISNNTCSCNSGWKGDSTCSVFSCDAKNNCNGHGSCTSSNVCQCNSGWKGNSDCSVISCDGVNNCNNHGTCIGSNSCSCNSGWKGDAACSVFTCDGLYTCPSEGTCVSNNTCFCNGAKCVVYNCYGISAHSASVCNGNGQCNFTDYCMCQSGFVGQSCSLMVIDSSLLDLSITVANTKSGDSIRFSVDIDKSYAKSSFASSSILCNFNVNHSNQIQTYNVSGTTSGCALSLATSTSDKYDIYVTLFDQTLSIPISKTLQFQHLSVDPIVIGENGSSSSGTSSGLLGVIIPAVIVPVCSVIIVALIVFAICLICCCKSRRKKNTVKVNHKVVSKSCQTENV